MKVIRLLYVVNIILLIGIVAILLYFRTGINQFERVEYLGTDSLWESRDDKYSLMIYQDDVSNMNEFDKIFVLCDKGFGRQYVFKSVRDYYWSLDYSNEFPIELIDDNNELSNITILKIYKDYVVIRGLSKNDIKLEKKHRDRRFQKGYV